MDASAIPALIHPLADTEDGIAILRLYREASSEAEWRFAVSCLVVFLMRQSAPSATLSDPRFEAWTDKVLDDLRRGFRGAGRGRPSSVTEAKRDAAWIEFLLDEPDTPKTAPEATQRLAEYARVTLEAARKRVTRAQKAAGLKLEKGRPFGHKGSPKRSDS